MEQLCVGVERGSDKSLQGSCHLGSVSESPTSAAATWQNVAVNEELRHVVRYDKQNEVRVLYSRG